MAKFHLHIDCDNDAFASGNLTYALADILKELAANLELVDGISGKCDDGSKLVDENGSIVGAWHYEA